MAPEPATAGRAVARCSARRPAALAPLVPAVAVVALQIAYPLAHGTARDHLTVAIVITLAATCVLHAGVTRGPAQAATVLLATALPGFGVEVLGVHTGVPFGSYTYSSTLGPQLFGVPLVIGLAWTMLAWPAAVTTRHLVSGPRARVLVGAWALAAGDLFLDPQQVRAGQWRWADPTPHLPGVPGVPLTNYAGWLAMAVALSLAVQTALDRRPDPDARDDAVAIGLYLWLYVGWIVALAAFLGLPGAAAWGALGMGTVAVPLACQELRPRRAQP